MNTAVSVPSHNICASSLLSIAQRFTKSVRKEIACEKHQGIVAAIVVVDVLVTGFPLDLANLEFCLVRKIAQTEDILSQY